MKSYIKNGKVDRTGISEDICYGDLNRTDVETLIATPEIREAFFGTKYTKKIPQSQWNKKYLDILPNAAVADAFNEDYLMYLVDVYEYVNAPHSVVDTVVDFAKKNRKIVFAVIVIMAVIGGIIYFFDLASRKGGETNYGRK